jgi:hypothetical protein
MLKALPCIGARRERRLCNAQRHARAHTFHSGVNRRNFRDDRSVFDKNDSVQESRAPGAPPNEAAAFWTQENSGEAF